VLKNSFQQLTTHFIIRTLSLTYKSEYYNVIIQAYTTLYRKLHGTSTSKAFTRKFVQHLFSIFSKAGSKADRFFQENNFFFLKQTADGTDDGIGVLSKLNGPVVIRFVSDDQPGFAVRYVKRHAF
jgi:hypothetical protein